LDGISPHIRHEPDPDHPGWWTWDLPEIRCFHDAIGKFLVRSEGEGRARCRIFPEERQCNLAGLVHGGAILAFIDTALFAGGKLAGISDISHGVTLDLNAQFIAPARPGAPLDAAVELLRETGRLAFMRGTVEQEGVTVTAWSGCLRKGGAPK
jgi:uncharacterized protein (TIGR00369 family)